MKIFRTKWEDFSAFVSSLNHIWERENLIKIQFVRLKKKNNKIWNVVNISKRSCGSYNFNPHKWRNSSEIFNADESANELPAH